MFAVATPASADISAFPATDSGIHMEVGLQGVANPTQADAVSAAKMADVVVGLQNTISQYGAAMRQANPNVKLFVYFNAELVQSADCSTFPASWYLYGANGAKVTSKTHGNCAMYPMSTQPATIGGTTYNGWMDYVKKTAAAKLAQAPLASGMFLDQTSSALNSGFASTLPVDPATKALYTNAEWTSEMGQILQTTEQYTGKAVIGNSYEGGSRYWKSNRPINTFAADAHESEHFLDANQPYWTNLTKWQKNVNMMIDAQQSGKGIFVNFPNSPTTNLEQWRQYVTASYLMGNNGHAFLNFSTATQEPYQLPSALYSMQIGTPLKTATNVSGYLVGKVYQRQFTNGIALVNLSGGSQTVSLGGTYYDVSGKSMTSITLTNGTGAVLHS
ncbi:MAG: hypothetical protein ACTHNU_03955 [Gaiellales bacterium]